MTEKVIVVNDDEDKIDDVKDELEDKIEETEEKLDELREDNDEAHDEIREEIEEVKEEEKDKWQELSLTLMTLTDKVTDLSSKMEEIMSQKTPTVELIPQNSLEDTEMKPTEIISPEIPTDQSSEIKTDHPSESVVESLEVVEEIHTKPHREVIKL